MVLDSQGNVLFAGSTNSTDLPFTPDAYDTLYNGGNPSWVGEDIGGDIFLAKLKADLSADVTAITEPERKLPRATVLYENYPNPFNPQTTLRFSLQQDGYVILRIYNIKGQLVRTLVEGERSSGEHLFTWDGKDALGRSVSSGTYFSTLTVNGEKTTRKMVLVR
jgi:hypothetical protein